MTAETISPPDPIVALQERSADYDRIARALAWLAEHWHFHPSLDDAAAAVGLSPSHFQRVFTRWAGVSPKAFTRALAHSRARHSLEAGASVLEAALDAGLSGPSRLHDLFLAHEAATPGEARRRGEGMSLSWGLAPSPFGEALLVLSERSLTGLAFTDSDVDAAYKDMYRRWPAADWRRDDRAATEFSHRLFTGDEATPLALIGPPFHIQVWKALLRIPSGATATYSQVAQWAGRPGAARATGAAIGANPISLLIPCHRVLARDGRLTGYHWGMARKAAMLGMEASKLLGRDAA